MKKSLVMIAVAAVFAAVPASSVLAKGHVPDHKEQVCHKGRVLAVGASAVSGHVGHGDVMLDKNDPNAVFFTGDACVI